MSEPILPLRQWPSGIQQASVPANDNALREEAVKRPALGVANDASGSDADGDMWIVGSTPAGAFATFEENDVALYQFGSWYAWAPVDGLRLVVNDVPKIYVGGSTNEWQDDTSDGIPDAPSDGTGYVRKDGAWAAESGGGGGSDVLDVSTPSNASGTVTLDFASKTSYAGAITLGANVTTLAFSNLPGSGKFAEYELHITQDGTGSRTFAIPASHKALGGSDTAIASAANAVTVLTASTVDNGTTWRYAMQESA